MTEIESIDWNERSEEIFREPGDRVPLATSFGFCAYDDGPAPLGGGFPWFYWFESKSEMLSVLEQHSAYLHRPRGEFDEATINGVVRTLIASANGDLVALHNGLNEKLAGLSQFIWIGSFADLCSSVQPEAEKLRRGFRDNGNERPITDGEMDDFAEFTATYGV